MSHEKNPCQGGQSRDGHQAPLAAWEDANPANHPSSRGQTAAYGMSQTTSHELSLSEPHSFSRDGYSQEFLDENRDQHFAAQGQLNNRMEEPGPATPNKPNDSGILGRAYSSALGCLPNLVGGGGGGNETSNRQPRPQVNRPAKTHVDPQGRRLYTLKDLQREIGRELGKSEERLRTKEEEYNHKIEMLTAKLDSQNEIVSEAQESALRFLKDHKTVAIDDGQIHSKLEGMTRGWRTWAKDNAHKSIERVSELKGAEKQEFLTLVGEFIQVDTGKGIPDEFITPGKGSITPAVILQGMLANLICTKLMAAPFLFLGDSGAFESPGESKTFSWTYKQLLAVNEKEGHLWRSNMLRLLSRFEGSNAASHKAEKALQDIEQCRAALYERLAINFLRGPARVLLNLVDGKPTQKQEQDLLDHIVEAGNLSAALWSQRSLPDTLTLSRLSTKPFLTTSKYVRSHESQRSFEQKQSLDGLQVGMVVQPAIIAWGNENAENYASDRVWIKASVWLKGVRTAGEPGV